MATPIDDWQWERIESTKTLERAAPKAPPKKPVRQVNNYKYIGASVPGLYWGMTALGRQVNGSFSVQMDDFIHQWSHGWHAVNVEDWEVRQ